MWVIINKSKKEDEYYAIDKESGGYAYWSSSLKNAEIFKDIKNIEIILGESEFTKDIKISDSSIHPPRMIHNALGLCNTNKKAEGEIIVSKIKLIDQFRKEIKGEIT